jgi:hypothetical protein
MKASRYDSAICIDKVLAFLTGSFVFQRSLSHEGKSIHTNTYKDIKLLVSNITLYLAILICAYLQKYGLKYTAFYGLGGYSHASQWRAGFDPRQSMWY